MFTNWTPYLFVLFSHFKCFQSVCLLSFMFGGKATRLSDSLQAEQSHLYLWKQSLLCSSLKKKKKILHFFLKAIQVLSQLCQSVTAAVSMMPSLQSTEMAQLKALLLVKGKKKVCAVSARYKADRLHSTLSA